MVECFKYSNRNCCEFWIALEITKAEIVLNLALRHQMEYQDVTKICQVIIYSGSCRSGGNHENLTILVTLWHNNVQQNKTIQTTGFSMSYDTSTISEMNCLCSFRVNYIKIFNIKQKELYHEIQIRFQYIFSLFIKKNQNEALYRNNKDVYMQSSLL